MAAVTRHLEFTTGVYIAPARDLITVAKQVGTAAVISSNRVAPRRRRGVVRGGVRRHRAGLPHPGQAARRHDPGAAGAVGAAAGSSTTGRTTTCPPCGWSPSPTGPDPHHRRRPLRPGSAPGRRVCATAGWRPAPTRPTRPRRYLGELAEAAPPGRARERAVLDLPVAVGEARPRLYRSFEEDYGVTDMLCAPAMVAEVDPSDSPEAQLQTRHRRLGPLRRRDHGEDAMTT